MIAPAVLSLLFLSVVSGQLVEVEEGYEILYSSNPLEMDRVVMNCSGKLPEWLKGCMVRVGPAQFEIEDKISRVPHGLDGFAKLALWSFKSDNSIHFTTKFIQSTYYKESLAKKRYTSNIFLEPPTTELTPEDIKRSQEVGIDNMVISIMDFHDIEKNKTVYVATNDIWSVYEFSLEDLSTLGKITPKLPELPIKKDGPEYIKQLATAHPLPEYSVKENRINILMEAALKQGEPSLLKVVRMKSLEKTELIAKIEIPEIRLLHSFSVTKTKVVIVLIPHILDVNCQINNKGDCYKWKPEEKTIIHVVELDSGKVHKMELPSIFVWHHINAYDIDNDELVVDVASYSSPVVIDKFVLETVRDPQLRKNLEPKAEMKRIRIHLWNTSAILETIESPTDISKVASTLEFPTIDETKRSLPYCYVYGIVEKLDDKNVGAMGIAKKDLCIKDGHNKDALFERKGWYPSEPEFVPRPGASEEDDGVLLVPLTSGAENRTSLVILNAVDLTLIAEAFGPTFIPQSQHGKYFP